MAEEAEKAADVASYYSAVAKGYHQQYERDALFSSPRYPANYFRLQLLLNSFVNKGLGRIIEVGVGEGTPLATMVRAGMDVWGFDISEDMVARSRQVVQSLGLPEERVFWGDIQDPLTYVHSLREGQFDGVVAMGVMPHVVNDDAVLQNMGALVRPGGSVFIEFRNKLFSLFTFNRYTYSFILDDLLRDVSPELKAKVAEDLEGRLRMDLPPVRATAGDGSAPGYDAILSKFHNPLEANELFTRNGFGDVRLLWYHYHPTPPMLQQAAPELFRRGAIGLEHESSGWRGLFLCSAYVVEATKL